MPQVLPFVPSTGNYRFGTTLRDTQYIFDVRWNSRAEAWYFDLLTEDEVMIRAGMKIVLGVILGSRSVDPNFPEGFLIAGDLSNRGLDAGYDDLGTRVMIYFYSQDEIDELDEQAA